MADLFSLREKEIFSTLNALKGCDFVVIGGYAVNAYALPRFSVDCDIVVKGSGKIEKILPDIGYAKKRSPYGSFLRFVKKIENNFEVSMDILVDEVIDRMTGAVFTADWIFDNSRMMSLKGRTMDEALRLRVINIDALIVMKIVSCRATDIRDVFMLMPNAKDKGWIKKEVGARCDFKDRIRKIADKVESKQFRDGLAGVYGYFDQKVFDKHKKMILSFGC